MVRLCYCETYCLFIMLRRPPRSTRTYTRCPCTTLCRSRRTRRGILCRGATTEWQRSDKERHAEREGQQRSEEHTSELQSLMRISYAVFCLKKTTHQPTIDN